MRDAAQAVFRFEPGRVGHRTAQGEKMGEQNPSVRRIRPSVGNADHGTMGMDNSLRYAVGSVLDDGQTFSRR